jgi:hypothetical protein
MHTLVSLAPALEIIISILLLINSSFEVNVFVIAYIMQLNVTNSTFFSSGGILEKFEWTGHLTFNIAFAGLAITVILLQAKIMEKGQYKCYKIFIGQLDQGTSTFKLLELDYNYKIKT